MKLTARVWHKVKLDSIKLRSYAKINLTLDVHPPRPDGYHDIESIMQTISLHDVVIIEKAAPGVIEVTTDLPHIPSDERNLAHRAVVLLNEAGKLPSGVKITINKQVPTQAGLGGGSSNGAAVLVGINRLLGLGLDDDKLSEIAASIGSDAAFFIHGGTALAEGRGEKLTELDDVPVMNMVIAKPNVGVATPWAYGALDEIPGRKPGGSTGLMMEAMASGSIEHITECMANDFEQVVLPKYRVISEIKDRMMELGAMASMLSGSGSAVFGVFSDDKKAVEVSRKLQDLGQVYTARTVGRAEAREPWL